MPNDATAACRLLFLLDVDNTLIDNDGLRIGLNEDLEARLGTASAADFWVIYEAVRAHLDMVDFPTILDRFCSGDRSADRPDLERLLYEFDFAGWRFPDSLPVIRHLRTLGTVLITSDGDTVFQVAKVTRSELGPAVDAVHIVPHKQAIYAHLSKEHSADRYVIVDDKPGILAAARTFFGPKAYTVHMRHGKYAHSAPEANLEIDAIGDLLACSAADFCP